MSKTSSLTILKVLVESSNGGGGCSGGGECPTVYELSDGSIAIQGFKVERSLKEAANVPGPEDMVVVPRAFLDHILSTLKA